MHITVPLPGRPHEAPRHQRTALTEATARCNAWLSGIKEIPAQDDRRRELHNAAIDQIIGLERFMAAAFSNDGRGREGAVMYQELLMKVLKTAILSGDTDWVSMGGAHRCFTLLEQLPARAGFLLEADQLRDMGVDPGTCRRTWTDCQYNFARQLTYERPLAPTMELPGPIGIVALNRASMTLHDALIAVDFTTEAAASIAGNEFAWHLLQSLRPYWGTSDFDSDPLVRDVGMLRACYVDALGNRNLEDDLAVLAERCEVYIPGFPLRQQ